MRYRINNLRGITFFSLLIIFAACEDPSNVGIGLVGEQGGQPTSESIPPSIFQNEAGGDVTGALTQFLAGRVQDPILSTISATGYLDFVVPTSVPSNFRSQTVNRAELHLFNDYQYGDTTTTLTLRLLEMPSEWEDDNATADTVLTQGSIVTEFSFPVTDSVIVVPLPEDWVLSKDTTLRSISFNASFHGFALEGVGESAVVGFLANRSTLRVFAGSDSVSYVSSKTITTLERIGDVTLPEDRVLLQDGVDPGIKLMFDFEDAGVLNNAINRAFIRIAVDTTFFNPNTPTGFQRPLLRTLELVGVSDTGLELTFGSSFTFDEDGYLNLSSSTLTSVVQTILLGDGILAYFLLRAPVALNTINPLILYGSGAETNAPEIELTITPLTD